MFDSRPLEEPAEIRLAHSRRRSASLRWLLLGIALLMVGMSLVDHLMALPGESRALISLSMGGLALLSYLLLRAHPGKWRSPLMVVGMMVITTWGVYSHGSVRAASALAFLAAVVMAGTYLSLRALWATTVTGVLILGGLTWAEAGGYLVKPVLAADLRYWMMGCVVMAVIGALLHHTRKATDEAYLMQLSQMEDRLRLEHERDQSKRRFQRIFNLNPTALMVQFAGTRTVLDINPAFERAFGYPGSQLVGQPAARLWADDLQWQAHCKLLFERGKTDWQHSRWLRADGQSADVVVCSELSGDPGGMLILTTVLPSVA
jgi:PAS domain S-box-containing protein